MDVRVEAYVRNVAKALEEVRARGVKDRRILEILDIVNAYLKDSVYYLSRGDYASSLAAIAYAEGLLDALRLLGLAEFNWERASQLEERARTKVLVAGTFEIIHPGHIHYLRKAWELGRVVAIVARDSSVSKFKSRDVVIPEEQRLAVLNSIVYVHKARLGYEDDIFRVVEEERPSVILLGPNQPFDPEYIKSELRSRGINSDVLRLEQYLDCPLCSTRKIINAIINRYSRDIRDS